MNKRKSPIKVMCNIRLTKEQHEQLRRYAWDKNISIAQLIRGVLEGQSLISPTVKELA